MRPRILYIIAAALVLVVCRTAFDDAGAKITRDGKGSPSNPPVEAGGYHLTKGTSAPVSYSLVGAVANESQWVGTCSGGPWRLFDMISQQRNGIHGKAFVRRINANRFNRLHSRPW
jgi:hypothetical protein